ncbi:T6SS effector phospholipase Tle3 domain-containing protein [Lonsdalea quercina]|uniref:T6SS effector phospholipase Tle3 domain-containing protein n=1 Tax=Lonsdalea quercina TaxID=71657 RepID=UPI003976967B
MNNNKTSPTRKVDVLMTDNGTPFAYSTTSHKNVKVNAEVRPPLQLPGLVIFVHGVNSEGEWYNDAEKALCDGLNQRLGLNGEHILVENIYAKGDFENCDKNSPEWISCYGDKNNPKKKKWITPPRKITDEGRSPVIRFYWGYRATDNDIGKYAIPLKNKEGDNYYDLTPEQRKSKGPFYWGGGPFQNGCNQLVSLWSDKGFDNWPSALGVPVPFSTQLLNGERDRLLTAAPPRHYYAHAAGRLAKLIKTIRDKHPEDTVTVLSHSQGTMIALAAAAIEAPDALFVMNSPYALDNEAATYISYPLNEIISKEAREATFADIVKKVAENKNRLQQLGCERLLAGVCSDGDSWTPAGKTHGGVPERDNHGTTWIYCNPHDRVMGSSPLRSIGWQGLPNTKSSNFAESHPLFKAAGDTLYVRMLGRNTPCGVEPNVQTHFSNLEDGKPFWDSTTSIMEKLTWPDPVNGQKLTINGPMVPEPLSADELKDFDQDYRSKEKQTGEVGYGYGQIDKDTIQNGDIYSGSPVDYDYRYYISLYGYFDQKMIPKKASGYYQPGPGSKDERVGYEKQSRAEMLEEIRTYVQRPTDHSTLPMDQRFMSRVAAYDLPIGYCWHSWDRESLAELRHQADWLESDDYYWTGKLTIPAMPAIIRREVASDAVEKKSHVMERLRPEK